MNVKPGTHVDWGIVDWAGRKLGFRASAAWGGHRALLGFSSECWVTHDGYKSRGYKRKRVWAASIEELEVKIGELERRSRNTVIKQLERRKANAEKANARLKELDNAKASDVSDGEE